MDDMGTSENDVTLHATTTFEADVSSHDVSTSSLHSSVYIPSINVTPAFTFVSRWYLPIDVPLILTFSSVTITGLGNWLIIVFIACDKKLRKPFNILLVSLAGVYGLVATICAPMELMDVFSNMSGGTYTWCKFKITLRSFFLQSGVFLVFIIGVFRLLHGIHKTVFILRWPGYVMASLACGLGAVPFTLRSAADDGYNMCLCRAKILQLRQLDVEADHWRVYFAISITFFVAIVGTYLTLILKLHARERVLKASGHGRRINAHLVTSKIALWVFGGYLVACVSPFVAKIIDLTGWNPAHDILLHYLQIYYAITYLQVITNPLAYLWQNHHFRHRTTRALKCRRWRPASIHPLNTPASGSTSKPRQSGPDTPHLHPAFKNNSGGCSTDTIPSISGHIRNGTAGTDDKDTQDPCQRHQIYISPQMTKAQIDLKSEDSHMNHLPQVVWKYTSHCYKWTKGHFTKRVLVHNSHFTKYLLLEKKYLLQKTLILSSHNFAHVTTA